MIDMNKNMLVLAYLGDSIYEVYIRKYLVDKGISKVKELQAESIKYVSAKSQSNYLKQLIDNNLLKIEELIKLSRRTIINIKQNLFWAFIYNLLMIPVAQGMISFIKINPMIACIAMIISSLTVTLNALRLKIKK